MPDRTQARNRPRARTPTTPIHFRMPSPLRARLRRFAEDRHLTESEALRAALSEHLDEVESERELAVAERWQFEQAYATWQRVRAGDEKLVGFDQVERTLERALRSRSSRRGSRK